MSVGLVAGVVGGRALLWFMRRVALPAEGLYPLRTLASAFVIYGAATLAHGSGFLAVFIAGIILGDARAPFKREIERFHSALASLAEIVAFVILGLTVNIADLTTPEVWIPGLILGAAVAFLIRPALVGLCLLPVRLRWREKTFIVFAGLKGAVPILLASYLLAASIPQGQQLYGIVIIVVVFSVLVQGSMVPTAARVLRVPMRTVYPEPWSLGIRLRDEPEGFHRFTIAPGSLADGRTVEKLADLPVDVWVSFVVRDQQLLTVRGDTTLYAGDELLVLADDRDRPALSAVFETSGSELPPGEPT
jgi:cell volume regulation protein A